MQSTAADNVYNYTVYTPIPVAQNNASGVNASKTIKGTSGRNLTQNTNGPNDEYVFKLQDDGTLLNEMTKADVPIVDTTDVRFIMKKVSDTTKTLNPNEAFPEPAISGFQTTVN